MSQKIGLYVAIALAVVALLLGGYALIEAGNAVESMTLHPGVSATVSGAFVTESTTVSGSDGGGADVTWHSETSGDLLLWDASDVALEITGTAAQDALNVADGNVSIVDDLDVDGATSLDAVTTGAAGAGEDVQFFSDTSGDHLLWDASEEALEITGTDAQTALLVDDGNVAITDGLDVDGATTLDLTTIDELASLDGGIDVDAVFSVANTTGLTTLPIGVAHVGIPAIASVDITYTAAAGGSGNVLVVAGGTAIIVHDVWVETTTNFDATGDDATLNIGDSDDEDGFCVLADAEIQAAYAAFTGAAAGWSCNTVATREAYFDEGGTGWIGGMVYDGADTITWTLDEASGETLSAGEATIWVLYTRIK